MNKNTLKLPIGSDNPFDLGFDDNVLERLEQLTNQFGKLVKVYSPTRKAYTYVVTDPDLVKHVLVTNNRNYTKGVGIERVRILLGEGIMVSEGDYWKRQRRMIQPAFHRQVIANLATNIVEENQELITRWSTASHKQEEINLTEEMSQSYLKCGNESYFQ